MLESIKLIERGIELQSPSPPLNARASQTIDSKNVIMLKIGKILRITSLAILFAGSAAIVFAAITLVKIGQAKGLSISAAATTNAPIFLQFSKVAACAAVILLLAEAIDSFCTVKFTQNKIIQYIATALCCLCAFNFAFVIAPEMEHLLPYVVSNAGIQKSFHNLHEISRLLFAGIIFFAWMSIVVPIFYETKN